MIKLKATDYETLIVMGWYLINDLEIDFDKSNIKKSLYDVLIQDDDVLQIGKNIAYKIKTELNMNGDEDAKLLSRNNKSPLTEFWISYGAVNTTSKTDVLIGDKRISVKMGDSQLMSGGKNESIATFHAAVNKSNTILTPQYYKTLDIMNRFVTSNLAPTKVNVILKKGDDDIINDAEKAHKEIMFELGKIFDDNEKFRIEFAREAMSGLMKYGEESNSTAEYILVSDYVGEHIQINSIYDNDFCNKVSKNMKLQCRFKSSGRVIKKKKTGEYNYWSVISLITQHKLEEII